MIKRALFHSGNVYLMQVYEANSRILIGTTTSQNPEDITFSDLPTNHHDLLLFVRTIGQSSLTSDAFIMYAPAYKIAKNTGKEGSNQGGGYGLLLLVSNVVMGSSIIGGCTSWY